MMNYEEMMFAVSNGDTCYRCSNPANTVYRNGDTIKRTIHTATSSTSIMFVPTLSEQRAFDWEAKHEEETPLHASNDYQYLPVNRCNYPVIGVYQ